MGQQAMNFLTSLKWQDAIAIIGLLFGVITLIAYLDQRRSARGTAKVVEWAARNLDKSISEEQIHELLAQKSTIEEQIKLNLPALARKAVLQEQAELHAKAVHDHFGSWQKLVAEAGALPPISGIDPQLQQTILEQIVPRFQRQEERERLRTRVTVLSVGLAASSAVLPNPIGDALSVVLGLPLLALAVRLWAVNDDSTQVQNRLRPWAHAIYLLVAVSAGAIAGLILTSGGVTFLGRIVGWGGASAALLLTAAYPWTRRLIDTMLLGLTGAKRCDPRDTYT